MIVETSQDWTMRVILRMERFYENFFGELGDAIEERVLQEGWQRLATIEGIKPLTSTLHWPKKGKVNARAKFIGGLVGHTVSHHHAMCQPKLWGLVCEAFNQLGAILLGGLDESDRLEADENPFVDATPQFNAAITGVMRIASRQSLPEQTLFFEGYSKALRRGSVTVNAKGVGETTRTSAYQLIAAFSPVIQGHCRSVHDVHRFLERMLGRQRAGTIKRTEAICQTIGLRLRAAGRPEKWS
jgi:hypothetical protein